MKSVFRKVLALGVAGAIGIVTGCEWESADSFNTSRGAGGEINFSGLYTEYSHAVVSGTGVSRLLITQTGNRIEVLDNGNNYYRGTVGSPGVVATPDATGTYRAGANMLQAQVSFEGGDVQFVGVVHAIAVTDIKSDTLTYTTTRNKTETTTDTDTETESESTSHDATTSTVMDPATGLPPGPATVTTVTVDDTESTSDTDGETETQTDTETDTRNKSHVETEQFVIDESNTMYVLLGNWIQGGVVHDVNAISHAANGTFTPGGGAAATVP
jgi:hypothetical protein